MSISKYLKQTSEGKVINLAHEMKIYVPKEYFATGLAKFNGAEILTIGKYEVVFKPTAGGGEVSFSVDLPTTRFLFTKQTTETRKFKGRDEDEYNVFILYQDDTYMSSTTHLVSLEDATSFLNYLNTGKLPKAIKYTDLLETIQYNMSMNGINLPIPSALLELMVGEMARYDKDETIPFRRVAGRHGSVKHGFNMINIKTLPRITSVFGGLAFEAVNESLISGVRLTKQGRKQTPPHTEKAIYY